MTHRSVLLSLLLLLLTACGGEEKTKVRGDGVFEVRTLKVKLEPYPLEYRTSGYFESVQSVDVKPEVSGRVREIYAEEGDRVKKGDPLLKIDEEVYRRSYEEVLWRLRQAEEDLKKESAVSSRRKRLYEKELISREEFEEVSTRVEVLKAKIEELKALLKRMKLDLERTLVRSPTEGVILSRLVNVGDYVSPQTVTYSILNDKKLRFVFKVPQELSPRVKVGGTVEITVSGRRLNARISYVSPSADRARLITVKALVPSEGFLLKPNMYGEVVLTYGRTEAFKVPEQALQLSGTQSFLWVVRDSRAVKVPVKVLSHRDGYLFVEGGLSEGDRVVVEGLLFLYEGAKVRER